MDGYGWVWLYLNEFWLYLDVFWLFFLALWLHLVLFGSIWFYLIVVMAKFIYFYAQCCIWLYFYCNWGCSIVFLAPYGGKRYSSLERTQCRLSRQFPSTKLAAHPHQSSITSGILIGGSSSLTSFLSTDKPQTLITFASIIPVVHKIFRK